MPQPIAAISWILQLPHDLGLPDDSFAAITRPGDMHGWRESDLAHLPRWDATPAETCPVVALRFRRTSVGVGMLTEATDRCFSDMQTARMAAEQREAFEKSLASLVDAGMREWKTVVRITHWYAQAHLSSVEGDFHDWLRTEFRRGLSVVNSWLATYALASGNLFHGAVSLIDLPPIIPTISEAKDSPSSDERYGFTMLRIHQLLPAVVGAEGDRDAAATASRALLLSVDDHPFLTALQLLFGAQAHLASGREREAVLDGGTAVEMIVSAVLRAVAAIRSTFDGIAAAKAPFRGRFEHHLPLALGASPDAPDAAAHARAIWWDKGYGARNAVVHEGVELQPEEAAEAVASAWSLIDVCGQQLRAAEDTHHLGTLLQVAWR